MTDIGFWWTVNCNIIISYLNFISSTGYRALSQIEQTFNLTQLGLDTLIAPRVQEAIRQQTNVVVELEELRKMTFPGLRAKILDLLAWNTVHILLHCCYTWMLLIVFYFT